MLLPALPAVLLAAAVSPPGPTLAIEDTMHTEVPEVVVRAPRVTLAEILDRVARGEARRDSQLVDQSFRDKYMLMTLVPGMPMSGGTHPSSSPRPCTGSTRSAPITCAR